MTVFDMYVCIYLHNYKDMCKTYPNTQKHIYFRYMIRRR